MGIKDIFKKILKDEKFFSTNTPGTYKTQDALEGTMTVYNTTIEDSGRVVDPLNASLSVQTITITRTVSSEI